MLYSLPPLLHFFFLFFTLLSPTRDQQAKQAEIEGEGAPCQGLFVSERKWCANWLQPFARAPGKKS